MCTCLDSIISWMSEIFINSFSSSYLPVSRRKNKYCHLSLFMSAERSTMGKPFISCISLFLPLARNHQDGRWAQCTVNISGRDTNQNIAFKETFWFHFSPVHLFNKKKHISVHITFQHIFQTACLFIKKALSHLVVTDYINVPVWLKGLFSICEIDWNNSAPLLSLGYCLSNCVC